MTYLWQEERGCKVYRIQTDNKAIANKLKRRQKFRLAAQSFTHPLWVFVCHFARPDIAKKTLTSITGRNGNMDSDGCISFDECKCLDIGLS